MKQIHRNKLKNIYVNIDKEENWLNSMAEKGLSLREIKDHHYIFDETKEKQYEYKIDFLKQGITNNEINDYLDFLTEMDIEVVFRHKRFVYLRKRYNNSSAPFALYSDSTSKIAYYKGYNSIKYILALALIVPNIDLMHQPPSLLIFKCVFLILGSLLIFSALPIQKMIFKLRDEENIHE